MNKIEVLRQNGMVDLIMRGNGVLRVTPDEVPALLAALLEEAGAVKYDSTEPRSMVYIPAGHVAYVFPVQEGGE